MVKRISERRTGKLLAAAAVASLGLAGFAQQADASLVIDVRALAQTGGSGVVITPDGKSVVGNPSVTPTTVTFGVFATVTGTNSNVVVNDFNSGGDDDTGNDEALGIVTGSFLSSNGGLLGNMANNIRVGPFNGSGSTNGVLADLDGDGDLDIGSLTTDPTNMFAARTPTQAAAFLAAETGVVETAPSGGTAANGTTSSASGSTYRIGTLRWVIAANGSGNSSLNFLPRPDTTSGTALWTEDGAVKNPSLASFGAGAPVSISVIPEPATLGLLGLAGLGLLARRRNA